MTGGGITWNRGEIGPCRFWYFTLPVNLVAGVRVFKSSCETFMSEFMTARPEKLKGCHPCPVAAAPLLDVGRTPWDPVGRLRKFSFNCPLKFFEIAGFIPEL